MSKRAALQDAEEGYDVCEKAHKLYKYGMAEEV